MYQLLIQSKLLFLVDRLFFPQCSHFVASHFIVEIEEMKVEEGNFILLVTIYYRNLFIAELYSIYLIMKLIEAY